MNKKSQIQSTQKKPREKLKSTKPIKIFVHGLHPFTSKEDLKKAMLPFCKITTVEFKKHSDTQACSFRAGYAFFFVDNEEIAEKIVKSRHIVKGRQVNCDYMLEDEDAMKQSQKKRVFIGGLIMRISDNDLIEFFEKFGDVRAAYAIKDITGYRKKFGFVDFFDEESAVKAIKASPVFIKGKKIDVRPYKKKSRKNSVSSEGNLHLIENQLQENFVRNLSGDFNFEMKIALPNERRGVLDFFMNRKGEEMIQEMRKFNEGLMLNQLCQDLGGYSQRY